MCSNVSPEATLAPLRTPGEEVAIAAGAQRAVVVTHGGGLRMYSNGTRQVIDGYRSGEPCRSGRGQVLIPWPNRLEDGSYEFDGLHHQLELTEPEHGNAIHGLVREATWTITEREPHRVVMEHLLQPQPGYPFTLALRIEYDLSADGLRVSTTATNAGPDACPYGSGAHPYLTVGTASVDSAFLRCPGWTVLRTDERGLPVSTTSPTSNAAQTAWRGSSSRAPERDAGSSCGSTTPTAISCSSPATRWPTSTGAASPSSR